MNLINKTSTLIICTLVLFFSHSDIKAQAGCCSAVNFNDFQTYCIADLSPCVPNTTCNSAALNAAYGITGNWINFGCNTPSDCSLRGCGALPVELAEFDLVRITGGVMVHWTTASETDNEGFEIERSVDGINWTALNFTNGVGTSVEMNHYSYFDKEPVFGFNYYRIKQIDYNGEYDYSPVKVIIWQGSDDYNNLQLAVLPNPASEWITAALPSSMSIDYDIEFSIFDQSGKLVRTFARSSDSEIRISLDGLPNGFYVLNARQGRFQESAKFVKK